MIRDGVNAIDMGIKPQNVESVHIIIIIIFAHHPFVRRIAIFDRIISRECVRLCEEVIVSFTGNLRTIDSRYYRGVTIHRTRASDTLPTT